MSKEVKYTCNNCNTSVQEFREYGWVEIGSNDSKNFKANSCKRTMSNHHDLHFCSGRCISEYFFTSTNNTSHEVME